MLLGRGMVCLSAVFIPSPMMLLHFPSASHELDMKKKSNPREIKPDPELCPSIRNRSGRRFSQGGRKEGELEGLI